MSNDRPEPSRPEEPDKGLDVDAAFADIVARWEPSGESTWPQEDHEEGHEVAAEPAAEDDKPAAPSERDDADGLRHLFRPAYGLEPQPDLEPDDEGHFVPPPPPPLPTLEPRRKAAWIALVSTPTLALVLLVAGVIVPEWMVVGLVVAFVGGFGYLVATMGASPPDDWSSGDGAVL